MGRFRRLFALTAFFMTPLSTAFAHEATPGGSGFWHAMGDAGHFIEFLVVGTMSGLYVRRFGGALYVYGSLLPLVLLASHLHVPITSEAGVIFACGFLGGGFAVAAGAARVVIALVDDLGARPPSAERD